MKAQYNVLMDSIKQTSFQNLRGELDSHMENLSGQVRAHQAQQALSLHKVDMEASVMEVSFRLNQESVCSKYSVYKRTVQKWLWCQPSNCENVLWISVSLVQKIQQLTLTLK